MLTITITFFHPSLSSLLPAMPFFSLLTRFFSCRTSAALSFSCPFLPHVAVASLPVQHSQQQSCVRFRRHERILHALSVMLDSPVIAWHGIGAEAIARLALNPDNEEIMSAWGNKASGATSDSRFQISDFSFQISKTL